MAIHQQEEVVAQPPNLNSLVFGSPIPNRDKPDIMLPDSKVPKVEPGQSAQEHFQTFSRAMIEQQQRQFMMMQSAMQTMMQAFQTSMQQQTVHAPPPAAPERDVEPPWPVDVKDALDKHKAKYERKLRTQLKWQTETKKARDIADAMRSDASFLKYPPGVKPCLITRP